jgi:hypothetical protein
MDLQLTASTIFCNLVSDSLAQCSSLVAQYDPEMDVTTEQHLVTSDADKEQQG